MKRILTFILAIVMVMSCLAGCQAQADPKPTKPVKDPVETVAPTDPDDPSVGAEPTMPTTKPPVLEDVGGVGFNKFDSGFIDYLNQNHGSENYMTSAMSLKMALALTAVGASDNTLPEMLDVVGYETLDEYLAWCASMMAFEADANEFFTDMKNNEWVENYEGAFSIANGIWHNSDQAGHFLESYKAQVAIMDAEFDELPGDALKDAINGWIDQKTNGLIPEMFNGPLNEYSTILVNALYMKNYWVLPFSDHLTHEDKFTTIEGEVVTKEFMEQTEMFDYYEDDGCQVLIMDMDCGFKMAVVLGDNSNIVSKLNQAKTENIHVVLPKFEIESEFDNEIVEYLQDAGMVTAFVDGVGAFDKMTDVGMFISKIIQKTKIAVDENGLEAAAVTAILMENDSMAPMDPVVPIDFIANQPFTFYIYAENENLVSPELLFYGQYVK